MRLVMIATGSFGIPTFRSLLGSKHDLVCLVTRPRIATRTRKTAAHNPMREVASQTSVPILAPEDANGVNVLRQLREFRADLLFVCDFGQLLAAETLAVATHGGLNLHGSLLPKYRGAAPVNWAIVNGEAETGVTVIQMTARLDDGPCLSQRKMHILPDETAIELESRLSELGADAVQESLEMLEHWDGVSALGTRQDSSMATRAPRLQKSDGHVDWSLAAEQIRNRVRGLKPWPGTYTHWCCPQQDPLRLILDQVSLANLSPQPLAPGTVVQSGGASLVVATGRGCLSIDRIQPAGKRVMDVDEFLRGHRLQTGEVLQ